MAIDLEKLMTAVMLSEWKAAVSAAAPIAGTMAGSELTVPMKNIMSLSKGSAIQALAAVGKSNASLPIDTLDIPISSGATEYEEVDNPSSLVGIKPDRTWKLKQDYSGLAWCYGSANLDRAIYLLAGEKKGVRTTRPIVQFYPDESPHEAPESDWIRLEYVDFFSITSKLYGLAYVGGRWYSFCVFVPPMSGSAPHNIINWAWDGTDKTPFGGATGSLGIFGEGARPSFAQRHHTDGSSMPFFLVEQGWIYGFGGPYSGPNPGDPNAGKSFITTDGDHRPAAMDILPGSEVNHAYELLVTMNMINNEIRWGDVSDWNNTSPSSHSLYKRLVLSGAASAGGVIAIAIDRYMNHLWALTASRELQQYILDDFVPEEDPPLPMSDNAPKALTPVRYPQNAQVDLESEVRYQLMDMWGRPTSRSGAEVEAICCNANGYIAEQGDDPTEFSDTSVSVNGIVSFSFLPHTEGTETILTRVVDEGSAL